MIATKGPWRQRARALRKVTNPRDPADFDVSRDTSAGRLSALERSHPFRNL
jgi:hypothetical protein